MKNSGGANKCCSDETSVDESHQCSGRVAMFALFAIEVLPRSFVVKAVVAKSTSSTKQDFLLKVSK